MPLTSIILIWRCVKRQAGKAEVKLVLNVGPPRKQANRGNSVNDSIAEGAFSARY